MLMMVMVFLNFKEVAMLGSSQNADSCGESRIEKMRKFLSSPLLKKKPAVLQVKTFGQPLETLSQKNSEIPFIVRRLCDYIQETGLTHEGLFRISGNARSVERLRVSFDRSGDAPLETEGDVSSAAALLKLFLRELPDPIIPLTQHSQFLNAVKDKGKEESVSSLAVLVDQLPLANYYVLSYLMRFLRKVSDKEEQNRMSASSLGIVFGPNLFRVTEDFVGLQEQSLTNQIVTYFILNYQDIFLKEPASLDVSSAGRLQLPTMVASWPEMKGSSSTMLSSWSLGPLSIQMHSDDTYLPLCPVSYSTETDSFALSELDEPDFCSVSTIENSKESLFEQSGSKLLHMNDGLMVSPFKLYQLDLSKDGSSHVDAEVSVRIPDLKSKVIIDDETGQVSLDTHKSYPRGRRRHDHRLDKSKRRSQSELRPSANGESLAHSSKQDPLHCSTSSLDDCNFGLSQSWPAFQKCPEDHISLSPLPQPLEVAPFSEASVSPSAFRSYLSYRNLHLDPSLPPSPPVEQEDIAPGGSFDDSSSSAKQITKKVHALKKKIKLFEENFQKLYGYKPTHSEKSSNITVRKMLDELNKAKQDLKQLKRRASLSTQDHPKSATPGLFTKEDAGALSIEESVQEAMEYLETHRKVEDRPKDLEEMSKEQLVAEKILVQKVLLNFESVHGRPSCKSHREVVRPLYDRYRATKRLIARLSDGADLQPILEHEAMTFPSAAVSPGVVNKDECVPNDGLQCASNKLEPSPHINFHELSLCELSAELNAAREEKKRIKKILREFEEQFKKENRRKIQREDKHCMESHYTEYKNVKAKLKLLEALLAKHEHTLKEM